MKKSLMLLFLIFNSLLFANELDSQDDVVMTVDPYNIKLRSYEEFKDVERIDSVMMKRVVLKGAPMMERMNASKSLRLIIGRNISVFVNRQLYQNTKKYIDRYVSDLEFENYNVNLSVIDNNGSPEDLKQLITDDYNNKNIEGAVLIGELPVAWYEIRNADEDTEFPSDYFFMDLDGDWYDNDNDDLYDAHSGSYKADIWVARIMAHNLTDPNMTEADFIARYFEKNHAYRKGLLTLENKSFTLVNKDWKNSGFDTAVTGAYADNTIVKDPNDTVTRAALVDNMQESSDNGYEYFFIAAHSNFRSHHFNTGPVFWNTEIEQLGVEAIFMNLFACSAARYTEDDSLGVWYTMQSDYGLNAVGSTKTGSMKNFSSYFNDLEAGKTQGETLLQWFKDHVVNNTHGIHWYYGVSMLGDPTLKLSRFMTKVHNPATRCEKDKVYDCDGKCVLKSRAESWKTDNYCDKGKYGMNLVCKEFDFDDGKCGETPAARSRSNTMHRIPNNRYAADLSGDGIVEWIDISGSTLKVKTSSFNSETMLTHTFSTNIDRVVTGRFEFTDRDNVCVIFSNGKFACYALNRNTQDSLWFAFSQWNIISSSEEVVVGDFDGDEKDEMLVYKPSTGTFKLLNRVGSYFQVDSNFDIGNLNNANDFKNKKIYVGNFANFDGEGVRDDIAIYDESTNVLKRFDSRVNNDGKTTFWWAFTTSVPNSGDEVTVANVNGGYFDEIVIYNKYSGSYHFYNRSMKRVHQETGNLPFKANLKLFWLKTHTRSESGGNDRHDLLMSDQNLYKLYEARYYPFMDEYTYWWGWTKSY